MKGALDATSSSKLAPDEWDGGEEEEEPSLALWPASQVDDRQKSAPLHVCGCLSLCVSLGCIRRLSPPLYAEGDNCD